MSHQTTALPGLIDMTDLEIEIMSPEEVKQKLMDLRQYQLVQHSNEEVARLGNEEATQMLYDARAVARRRRH